MTSNLGITASPQRRVVVLAGPNGAGKTSASKRLLQGELSVNHFVNADVIARGLSGFDPDTVAADAARIMIERMDKLAAGGESFAFETTLASRTHAPRLRELGKAGYLRYMVFLYLADPVQAIQRVASRVAEGGHHVPDETVRTRHERGLRNFFELYQPLTDGWFFYDNTTGGGPRLIAAGGPAAESEIRDSDLWDRIKARYA